MKSIIFVELLFCLLISGGAVLAQQAGQQPTLSQDYFKKLRIEMPGKQKPAPEFVLNDLSGKAITLKSLRGKVVFLNFWATWCNPCRREMPALEKLHREFRDRGLEIVGVNVREGKDDIRRFLQELGLTFTVLLDKDGEVSDQYGVWGLPVSYIISRKGEFVGKARGSREWDSKEAKGFFRELLEKE